MNLLRNANTATEVWQNSSLEIKHALGRNFHLRPTNSGITIVSTLQHAPMRGYISKTDTSVNYKLNEIYNNLDKLYAQEATPVKEAMQTLGFKNRGGISSVSLEEQIQARTINTMGEDQFLKEKLNAPNNIRFVASEFIFEQGKHKVDIIGFDGEDLYLFELKKTRTTKVEQVKQYVDYYSSTEKRGMFKSILSTYPINAVSGFNRIKGVMVMEYHPNTKTDWHTLAKKNSIDIIFYDGVCKWR